MPTSRLSRCPVPRGDTRKDVSGRGDDLCSEPDDLIAGLVFEYEVHRVESFFDGELGDDQRPVLRGRMDGLVARSAARPKATRPSASRNSGRLSSSRPTKRTPALSPAPSPRYWTSPEGGTSISGHQQKRLSFTRDGFSVTPAVMPRAGPRPLLTAGRWAFPRISLTGRSRFGL